VADERIDYEIGVSGDAAIALKEIESRLSALTKETGRTTGAIATLDHSIDEQGDAAKRAAAYNKLYERSTKAAGNEALKTTTKVNRMNRAMTGLNTTVNASVGGGGKGRKAGGSGFGKGGKGIVGGVAGGAIISMIARRATLLYLIISVIPALVTAVASLGAGIIGLAGALAPLGGLLVAYPGYLAAVGQAFITVKLALAGLTDAMKVYTDTAQTTAEVNKGLARFTGGGINKAVALPFLKNVSILRSEFTYIGYSIQRSILPGMTALMRIGQSMMPMIANALSRTGDVVASVLSDVGSFLSQGRTQSLIESIFGTNISIISQFSAVIKGALGYVLELVNAAGPMLKAMARDLAGFLNGLSSKATANAQNGGLAKFFQSTYDAVQRVLNVLSPLLKGLWNIMKIGKPLGDAILGSWGMMADKFQKFTESEKGIKKIADWFVYMTPILYELGYLIRDIAKGFAEMSMQSGFLEMSAALRTQVLPLMFEFISTVGRQMLPLLIQAATSILRILIAIQTASATVITVRVIAVTLGTINKILFAMDGLLIKVLGAFLAFKTIVVIGTVIYAVWKKIVVLWGVVKATWLMLKTAMILGMQEARVQSLLLQTQVALGNATMSRGMIAVKSAAAGARVAWMSLSSAIKGAMISTGIGIVVVGLSLLVEHLITANAETENAVAANKEWAESLSYVNGQLDSMSKKMVTDEIAKAGYIDMLNQFNDLAKFFGGSTVTTTEFMNALFNGGDELENTVKKLTDMRDTLNQMGAESIAMGAGPLYEDEIKSLQSMIDLLGGKNAALTAGAQHAQQASAINKMLGISEDGVADSAYAAGEAVDAMAGPMDRVARATERLTRAFQALNDIMQRRADRRAYLDDLDAALAALKKNGAVFNDSKKGRANMAAIDAPMNDIIKRAQQFYENNNKPQALKTLERGTRDITKQFIDAFGEKNGRKYAKQALGPVFKQIRILKKELGIIIPGEANKVIGAVGGRYEGGTFIPAGTPVTNKGQGARGGHYEGSRWVENTTAGKPPAVTATEANTSALDLNTTALNNVKIALGMIPNAPVAARPPRQPPQGTGGGHYEGSTWIPNRFAGGDIVAGRTYMVGELGPEAFIDRLGNMSLIGKDGPEVKQFHSSGYVVPNHELTPSMSVAAPTRSRTSSSDESGGSPINITIGDIHQATEFDVAQAVKRGLREAERDRRERG
jgi:hypothetical protein